MVGTEITSRVLVGRRLLQQLREQGIIPPNCSEVTIRAGCNDKPVEIEYRCFADTRLGESFREAEVIPE